MPEPVYIELEKSRYTEYADRYRAELSDAELELADTGLVYRTFSHNKLNVQPKPPDPPPSRVAFTTDARFTMRFLLSAVASESRVAVSLAERLASCARTSVSSRLR